MLNIKGCIVTIDAMGTQTDIAETIIDNDADYILSLRTCPHRDHVRMLEHDFAEDKTKKRKHPDVW